MLSFRQYLLETIEDLSKSSIDLYKPRRPWVNRKEESISAGAITLDKDQKHSVGRYTASGYRTINDYLRNKLDYNDVTVSHVNNISAAIDKSKLPKDVWLHHGMRTEPENNEKKARGFMSTSIHPYTTTDFTPMLNPNIQTPHVYFKHTQTMAIKKTKRNSEEHKELENNSEYRKCNTRHVLHFHAPKGSRALFLDEVLSNNPHEKEVLLHHGAHIKFHKKPRISNGAFESDIYVHWYGKLVHDGIEPTRHAKGGK